ncbi:hypothetical protein Deba_2805 [Desulfarculus baarsii DSM 2075]|uniref:Uncharacterized protein n=1 Tax=Desulfarculus baarsii (strain ATCC 33931 / DSM 2075 / LMG 7858 / VKM B-1802 / 2st14) TaxID=644282 RepID=E1QMB6_DESB2|nr:hypothetical protein [Desulfarculus baarsii]ADK86159.1 hypothetical protein Deba_2805 [Desulfarculus baarsii DSM 2075]
MRQKRQVRISATLRGVLTAVGDGLLIRTPYCSYPVRGEDLERHVGGQVEINGLLADEMGRKPVLQVESCQPI